MKNHKRLVLNIPVVHVCVDDIHALLLMNNFERRVLRIERTTAVHSRGICRNNFSCSVVSGAVLCKTNTVHIFNCERSELQICRVHQIGVECMKNSALYSRSAESADDKKS